MNKSIFSVLFALAVFFEAGAQVKKIELQASGLTCSMCSKAINKALSPLPFVKEIKTDLNKNLFIITPKDSVFANPHDIRQKVEEAGFSVARLFIEMNVSESQVQPDQQLEQNGYQLLYVGAAPRTLTGTVRLQFIDKGLVTAKEFKKFSGLTRSKWYKTGEAAGANRIYHVTL
ncbi:MAG: heavy-metal-associated domain-containing protein [Dinghuibacter sp.]|nr:heavy-metal-associated domain-containing protein [Dinghuibacter sp.]